MKTLNKGFDICYGCNKSFPYGSLKDVNAIDFDIFCNKCMHELYKKEGKNGQNNT